MRKPMEDIKAYLCIGCTSKE